MNAITYLRYLIKYRSNPLHYYFLNGKKVLDAGCGEGSFLEKDKQNRTGVDIDAKLVEYCVLNGLKAIVGTATDLQFPDNSYDAVHAAELIEHLQPQEAVRFLTEAARVLKPGGIVYLTTPGELIVWNTFSHIKPYPPMAFEKLLNKSTEGFLSEGFVPLRLEHSFAFGASSRFKWITGLKRALNIAIPARRPTGYVIILKKIIA